MRASADYRRRVLANLLQRLWWQTQGRVDLSLESGSQWEAA
jgi:xanthine dehydrogenase iron-sulfur cluster and FAD-binding subunit A